MQQESIDSIVVLIRVRPFNERERYEGEQKCFRIDEQCKNTMLFDANFKTEVKTFTFDHICHEQISQEEIFRVVGIPSARSCLQGYNGCIFAYGQTGAGKTYTIQGPTSESGLNVTLSQDGKERMGILPRVVEYMFSDIESVHDTSSNVVYNVKCSFLEIYNEQIIDLLNPSTRSLQVREDLKKGVYVEGLTELPCTNASEAMEVVRVGNRARHIGSTNMNIESSRSHSVFTFAIESRITKDGVTNVKTSRFSFVDLAGSERQKLVGTMGDRLKEGCQINKSLMVLANVINSLVDISDGKSRFVHYRDSKLTFLLKDSLGGNAKTSIIANISPAASSLIETLSTLKFAQRAKLIKSKVRVNETTSGTLESLKTEILRLRQELAFMRSLNPVHGNASGHNDSRRTPTKSRSEFDQSLYIYPNQSQNDSGWVLDEFGAEEGHRMRGTDSALKQSLDMLAEVELNLMTDFVRKEDLVEKLRGVSEAYNKNELQMKMIIRLLKDKAERFKTLLAKKVVSQEEFLSLIKEEEKNDLRSKILQILKEPDWEMKNDEPQEMTEIKEENQRLRNEYFDVVEALAAKESQLAQAVADGKSLSEVSEEENGTNNEENPSITRLPSEEENKFEKLRGEYDNLIGEYESLVIRFEEKNEELKKAKEDLERLEIEKRELAETLTKELSEKIQQEYNTKVESLKAEQKVNLEKSEEEALWMREENIDLQKKLYKTKDEANQTEEKFKMAKNQSEKLSSEVEELKLKLSQEKAENEKQIAETKEKMSGEQQMIAEENLKLKKENQDILSQYQEKEKEYEEVSVNYLKTRDDYISLQKEVQNVKTLCTELQGDYSAKEQEMKTLNQNLNELSETVKQKDNEIIYLHKEQENLKMLNDVKVQEVETLGEEVEKLQTQLGLKENEVGKLQESGQSKDAKIESLTKVLEELTQASTNKDDETSLLKLSLADRESDLMEKTQRLQEYQEEIRNLRVEMAEKIGISENERDVLSEKLKVALDDVVVLERKYEMLSEEDINLKRTIENLANEKEKLNMELSVAQSDFAVLEKKCEKLSEEEMDLKRTVENLSNEKEQLNMKLNVAQNELGVLEEENLNLKETIEKLESGVQEKSNNIDNLQVQFKSEKEELQKKLNALEEENSHLKDTVNDLENKLKSASEKSQEHQANSENLRNSNLALANQIEELKRESEKFQNECFNRVVEIESVSKDYKMMQKESLEKEQRFEELQKEFEELQKEKNQKQKEVICLKEERQELLNDISNKTQEAQILKQDMKELQNQNLVLEEKVQNMAKSSEEQGAKLTEGSEKLESLFSDLKKKQQEIEVKVQEVQELKLLLQGTQEERIALEEENIKQGRQIIIIQSEKETLNKTIEEFKKLNAKLAQDVENYKQSQGSNDEKVTRLQEQYEKSSSEYNSLTIEFGKLIEELAVKDQKLVRLEIDNMKNKEEIKNLEEDFNLKSSELAEKVREIDNKDEQLRAKLEEVGRIQGEIAKLTKTCEKLNVDKNNSDALEESLKTEINKLSNEMLQIAQEKDVKIARLEESIKSFEREINKKQEELKFTNNENEKLVQEREKIIQELNEVRKSESELAEENQQYLEELTKLEHEWQNSVQEVEAKKLELAKEYKTLKEELSSKANELNELTKLREDFKSVSVANEKLTAESKSLKAQWTQEKENYVNNEKAYGENLKKIKDQYLKLSDEFEILKTEIGNKDHEIVTFKKEHEDFMNERESLYQELNGYKEMEPKLRQEISEYSTKISGIYEQQESEINQMKDQYLKLAQDHKNLTKTILLKDDQLAKIRDELQHVFVEKEKLMEDLKAQKVTEVKLKKEKQEYYEKVTRLNNDQYLLLKEIDSLNKASEGAANQNNMAQKIKHLNKLKEENNELKTEKSQLCEDLALAIDQRDTLQKKLDEQLSKTKQDGGGLSLDIEKRNIDSQILVESLSRINSIVYTNLHKEDNKFFVPKVKDIESTLRGVQILCALIMEKNNRIRNRESELESTLLTNSILEKEVLLLKQKINLTSEQSSQNESINMSKSQHPPLDLRNKNRMPTPTRLQSNTESFYKVPQQPLNSSHRAGSTSAKRPENEGHGFDENFRSNASESMKKYSHLIRNPSAK